MKLNKILGILLCVAILLGCISVPAYGINHISTVEVTVATPYHGQSPEQPTVLTEKVTLYAHEWMLNGNKMSYGETFQGGKTYTLRVRLTTLDEFMESVSVKVNNLSASVKQVDYENTGLLFEKDFYVTPMGYTVTFDPGLGSGTMAPLTGYTAYTLPQCGFTAPSGKEFKCWRVENTNDLYDPGETIQLQKNVTLCAVWGAPSGKTKICDIEATSNIAAITALYGNLKMPGITVTKGAPAYLAATAANLRWQKYVNGVWTDQNNGRFTPGEWRIRTQVRIDSESAKQYELGNPVTLKVDGVAWTVEQNGKPNVNADYSMAVVHSPAITILNDPSIQPPVDITKLVLTVSGYKPDLKVQNAKVTFDNANVQVVAADFITAEDQNHDGIPETMTPATGVFKMDKNYGLVFTVRAKAGYDISKLTMLDVTSPQGAVMGAYNMEEDTFSGMCAFDPFPANPFIDVKSNQFYYDAVLWAVEKGITTGMTATTFEPNTTCTRGQIVTFLWRASGSPEPTLSQNPFADVKSNQYYYKAVLWAVEKGITTGMTATSFAPNAKCTRDQIVTFLWRSQGKPQVSGTNPFTDVKSNAYYYQAVLWAVEKGITTGTSATTFSPTAPCTRGQIVTFLHRCLG